MLAIQLKEVDRDTLRIIVDQLKQKSWRAAIILATLRECRVQLVAGVTKNCLNYFNAIDLLMLVAKKISGYGGGRPDLAQGGGDASENLKEALESVPQWIEQKTKGTSLWD